MNYIPPKRQSTKSSLQNSESQESSLENLILEKVNCLSNIISQINQEIEQRILLSGELIYQIDYQYSYVKSSFLETYQWQTGMNRSIDMRRNRLEQQLGQLLQEKRLEQSRCWKDISLLQKESRTWFKQYCDLVQRIKIILPKQVPTSATFKLDNPHQKPVYTGRINVDFRAQKRIFD